MLSFADFESESALKTESRWLVQVVFKLAGVVGRENFGLIAANEAFAIHMAGVALGSAILIEGSMVLSDEMRESPFMGPLEIVEIHVMQYVEN